MQIDPNNAFFAGDWLIQPELNALSRDGEQHHIEPKVMRVLLMLASQPNHVVPKDELIASVWPDTFVSDDVLTRCISILRRITADDAHSPHFIQTIPKVGYRLVAAISEPPQPVVATEESTVPKSGGASVTAAVQPQPVDNLAAGASISRFSISRFSVFGFSIARLLPVSVILALVLATVGGWWLRHRSPGSKPLKTFRTVQFTSFAGEQTQPAFSPDGKQIAFVMIPENGDSRQIYLKRIGSESMTRLVPGDDEQYSPVWSPDGRQIAYLSRSSHGLGIYLVSLGDDLKAKLPVRKVFIPQQPSHWDQNALSWSPDGQSLIFPDHTGSQPNSSIFELNVRTLDAHSITSPPPGWEGDLNPAFSPDGKKIAFTRASETAVRDIYWLSLADGKLHQLTHDRMNINSLAWSVDSSSVIFSSNRGGKYALWQMPLSKGESQREPDRLSVGTEDAYQPAVGPAAGELAYTQGSAIWNIVRLSPSGPASNPKGEPTQNSIVLSSTQQDSAPSLSPDGRFFAIQSLRSGSQEIWVASIGGDTLRQLTFFGGPLTGSPCWSHENDQVLFDSRPDGHSHIFVAPAAGGQPRQLTFGNDNDIIPRWSHDDRIVYFRSNRGGRWQLWKIPAAGGEPQPVTSSDGMEPQESPDGRYLYYTRGDEDGLWRMPTAGGPESHVLNQPSAEFWGYWQITPWGLFYLDRTQPVPSVRVFNPETRQTTLFAKLSQSPPRYAGISVADGGHTVLMTDQRDAGRHITLVEAQP